jgi:hypothetical protein
MAPRSLAVFVLCTSACTDRDHLVERKDDLLGPGPVPCYSLDVSIGLLEPDERSPAGFSPKELAEVALGEHIPLASWRDDDDYLGPESFTGPPRVSIEAREGVASWSRRPNHGNADWVNGPVAWNGLCPLGDLVRVPVTITWTIPWRGGHIEHVFDTTLEAQSLDPEEIWFNDHASYWGDPEGVWGAFAEAGVQALWESGTLRSKSATITGTAIVADGSLAELASMRLWVFTDSRRQRLFATMAAAGYRATCPDPPNCGPPHVYER